MKSLFRKLPWDFRPTIGGAFIILMVLFQELIVGYWMFAHPVFSGGLLFVSCIPLILIALTLILISSTTSMGRLYIWSHFVGTDVKCRDYLHQKAVLDWAWENHRLWSEFTEDIKHNSYEYSVRFRSRNKAVMAKLSVP